MSPEHRSELEEMLGRLFGPRIEPLPGIPAGVVIRAGGWLPRLGGLLAGHGRPAAAVTIGRTIIVHPAVPLTERLLQHELAHVRQWQQRPLLFPLHYVWQHVRHGYRDNPFEVEARAAERKQT